MASMIRDTIDTEAAIAMTPEFFGPLLPYIENEDITDIDYNGTDVWIRTCYGRRYKETSLKEKMTNTFVQRLTTRIQTSVSKEFNPQNPLLEAETKTLRISIVHESVCNGRRSICIRKTPTSVRIDTRSSVESGYASPELLSFLRNAVAAHFNLTICGEPGVGKTEFAKYVSMQIPEKERVITIEDNLEWHYHELKPEADCVEMQVSPQFDYYMAIKACLRQNPNWIMISEVRGKEVANYMQQLSTGVHGITTLHTGDVGDVPDRLCNMAADAASRDRMEGDIYTFLDIAVLVDMVITDDGLNKRRVSQVGMFLCDDEGKHKILRVFDNGKLMVPNLPQHVLARFARAHIDNPFINEDIVKQCEGLDLSSLDRLQNISSYAVSEKVEIHENHTVDKQEASVVEKRRYTRVNVHLDDVPIKIDDKFFKVHINNVSRLGIGFQMTRKLKDRNSGFDLIIAYPSDDKPILLSVTVVRTETMRDGFYYGCRINRADQRWESYINEIMN